VIFPNFRLFLAEFCQKLRPQPVFDREIAILTVASADLRRTASVRIAIEYARQFCLGAILKPTCHVPFL
jgi:hypothetical protein